MEASGRGAFEVVLKRAQELGYAEADPSFDVDGVDAAHKLTILASMAFGAELTYKEIPTEGIRGSSPLDFEAAPRVRLPHQAARRSRSGAKGRRARSASRCASTRP